MSVCCVISFPFSIWLAAATNTTFVRSKHQHYFSCKQQHCYCYHGHCLVGPPSLLLAAITIMVKNKLSQQHYIFFLYFVGVGSTAVAVRWQRQRRQRSSGSYLGGRGGSLAEAQFRRQGQRVEKRGGSAAAAAVPRSQWRQRGVC